MKFLFETNFYRAFQNFRSLRKKHQIFMMSIQLRIDSSLKVNVVYSSPIVSSTSNNFVNPLYQNQSALLEIAQHPLSIRAVDILLPQQQTYPQLEESNFSDIWQMRWIAETRLAQAGYENRLCYSKWESKLSPTYQVTAYPNLPGYLDNYIFKKIYSIFQQTKVLFRTFFPTDKPSKVTRDNENVFWNSFMIEEIKKVNKQKNGTGALTQLAVIYKQIVFPNGIPSNHDKILLLYNYAPLRTGGEQLHFLLIPNPNKPAKNFLELDCQQYINVLSLVKKVSLWAQEIFEEQAVIHYFDKTGDIAGQTQPLYHAHLIITKRGKEEISGRMAMFLRMFLPPRPLPDNELQKRVSYYRDTLGKFLDQSKV